MEEMQKMCKNMDQTNIPPFMSGMKMQHNEMMEEMQNMCKGDFRSCESCQEFMDKFMKK